MKISTPQNIDFKGISTLIFDWGGVITNLSFQATIEAFTRLGHPNFQKYLDPQVDDLFFRLEKGTADPDEIYEQLNREIGHTCTHEELIQAYSAMLIDTPPIRIQLLKQLRSHFKLYLLSNTNIIHVNYYNSVLQTKYKADHHSLFDSVFYSHEMGLRKPGREIFEEVLKRENLIPSETLFLDDTEINIETARSLDIKTIHVNPDNPIEKIFRRWI